MEVALVEAGAPLAKVVLLALLLQLLLQDRYLVLQSNHLLVLPLLAKAQQFPVKISLLSQFIDLCGVYAQNAGKLLPGVFFAGECTDQRLDVFLGIADKPDGDFLFGGAGGSGGALSFAGAVRGVVGVVAEPPSFAQHL